MSLAETHGFPAVEGQNAEGLRAGGKNAQWTTI
jgi:hypothetical protein